MAATRPASPSDRRYDVAPTLRDLGVHESWSSGYRTPENETYYRQAFGYVAETFGPPGRDEVLDAGCGSCTKAIHLARRGYWVLGVDLSESVLELGRREVAAAGLAD